MVKKISARLKVFFSAAARAGVPYCSGSARFVVAVTICGSITTRRAPRPTTPAPAALAIARIGSVAGRVSSAGARVDPLWLGPRVIAGTGESGGFAERAVADVQALFPVPDGLGLPDAIAPHSDGSTAQGLIEKARIGPGDRVLVEAAAGGVGSLLLQLARSSGARVIGAGAGPNAEARSRVVGAIGIGQLFGSRPNVPRWAEQILSRAAAGLVRPILERTFPLERAAEAHAAIENRTALGKTLLFI